MSYRLIPSRSFLKDVEKLTPEVRRKLEAALLDLKKDPYSISSLKKLANVDVGEFRIRIGDHRLRFDIDEHEIRLHLV